MERVNIERVDDVNEVVARAKAEAIARFTGENAVPPGCKVDFMTTVPSSGTEPVVTPVIRHPINESYASLPA